VVLPARRDFDSRAPLLRRPVPAFPELDCVRSLLPSSIIAAAERRAEHLGIGAECVLIAQGVMSEDAYLRALAWHLGIPFEPLGERPRRACPLGDVQLLQAMATGIMPLRDRTQSVTVVAPRNWAARRLCQLARGGDLADRLRLTSGAHLQRFVETHGAQALARRVADELRIRHPGFSAAPPRKQRAPAFAWLGTGALAALAVAIAPQFIHAIATLALAGLFAAWVMLRTAALLKPDDMRDRDPPVADRDLPRYTVIVALYREAKVVRRLIEALNAIDYPLEKLEIKLVVEADDADTRMALARLDLAPHFHIVVAPRHGPRTKPKALNAALPFARGAYVAVYDAEDRPAPDQLRRAVARFRSADGRLACVQARLTIDNTADSWLTRLFTAEYCGLFDVLLPALSTWRLPLPLGGSSNHFRTDVLRAVGAWDPYNVTEDADLGMRLARLGYRTSTIASTTYEEAPARLGPWLRQRTRWFKGWIQTWLVHMRAPFTLVREMGFAGFATFQLVVGGTVMASLVHLPITVALGFMLATDSADLIGHDLASTMLAAIYAVTLTSGYAASVSLALVGLHRRKLAKVGWMLLLMPLLWVLLSLAAWRALIEFLHRPYRWAKTEHGLAKTSRLSPKAMRPVKI
jgi:cellulose synthase/poly-beta-1,6-N-acetylglucosamine synthase-like glycosyltransferase